MNKESTQEIHAETLLTSYQVGSLLQVNPSSVNKWVKDGRIPAFRTPGGHRRIRAGDLVAFLNKHDMPVPASLAQAAQRRLLVVDNNAQTADEVAGSLKSHSNNIDIKSADNVVDALVLVGAYKPHVVLLNSELNGIDTVDVCKRLSSNPGNTKVNIVVMSRDPSGELAARAKSAGAQSCVQRSEAAAALLAALSNG